MTLISNETFCIMIKHNICSVNYGYDISVDDNLPFRVTINSNGVINWDPFLSLVTSCDMDLTYFPFDKQTCEIRFTNWMYGAARLINVTIDNTVNMDYYSPNGLWHILSVSSTKDNKLILESVNLQFVMQREPTYFVINIILPTICLSVLSVLVFLIEPDAGEKLGVSVTILMSYSVILLLISDNIPRNGKLPVISKYCLTNVPVVGK